MFIVNSIKFARARLVEELYKFNSCHFQLFFTIMAYIPYSLSGISRSFSAFLLPQLRLPESTLRITDEEETWIGKSRVSSSEL